MNDRKHIFENGLIRKTKRGETKEARLNRRHPIIIAMIIALVASIAGGVLSTLIIDQLHYHNKREGNDLIDYESVEKEIENKTINGTNGNLKVNIENSLLSRVFGEDEIELGILLRTFTGMSISAYFSLIVSHLFLQEKFKNNTQALISVAFGVIAALCICGIGMLCFDLLQL